MFKQSPKNCIIVQNQLWKAVRKYFSHYAMQLMIFLLYFKLQLIGRQLLRATQKAFDVEQFPRGPNR